MAMTIDDSLGVLLRDWLNDLAGTRTLQRGEAYFRDGAVRSKRFDGETVAGTVRGTMEYRVKLWDENGAIAASCTCPAGDEGGFCKHGVALALAWLDGGGAAEAPAVTMDEVRAYLCRLPQAELAELLMAQAATDEALHRRLFLRAGADKGVEPAVAALRGAFDEATDVPEYVHYREVGDYAARLDEIVDEVDALFTAGYGEAAISICEHGLAAVGEVLESFDDSDGRVSDILERLAGLHLAACRQVRPDPRRLAERVFDWDTDVDRWLADDAAGKYAEVLGEEGLAAYCQMAEAEWEKLPPLGPEQRGQADGRRRSLARIMERLAAQSGDVAALLAIKSRDLSSPDAFLGIAEIHKGAGRAEEALAWAERGWKTFVSERADERLRDFLVAAYHDAGRHDEAMDLVWDRFRTMPGAHDWESLKASATRSGSWPVWREKALAAVRARVARDNAAHKPSPGVLWASSQDRTVLVEVLLLENDEEAAWREAREGGCSRKLWLRLAARCAESQPDRALAVYREQIPQILSAAFEPAYCEAVEVLRKIERILIDDHDEFARDIAGVRLAHRRKRNFMKLLDKEGW
jgi:uncharacterized Zn finger protein